MNHFGCAYLWVCLLLSGIVCAPLKKIPVVYLFGTNMTISAFLYYRDKKKEKNVFLRYYVKHAEKRLAKKAQSDENYVSSLELYTTQKHHCLTLKNTCLDCELLVTILQNSGITREARIISQLSKQSRFESLIDASRRLVRLH